MWPDDHQRPLSSRDQQNRDEARRRLEEDYAAGAPRDLGGYLRWSAARHAREEGDSVSGHSKGRVFRVGDFIRSRIPMRGLEVWRVLKTFGTDSPYVLALDVTGAKRHPPGAERMLRIEEYQLERKPEAWLRGYGLEFFPSLAPKTSPSTRRGLNSGTTYQSLHEVERIFGAYSTRLDAASVLKPAGVTLIDGGRVFYLQKVNGATIVDRAWAVMPATGTVPIEQNKQDVFAAKLGKKLFTALIGKRNVHYTVPHLHDHRLYILLPHHAHVVIPRAAASR